MVPQISVSCHVWLYMSLLAPFSNIWKHFAARGAIFWSHCWVASWGPNNRERYWHVFRWKWAILAITMCGKRLHTSVCSLGTEALCVSWEELVSLWGLSCKNGSDAKEASNVYFQVYFTILRMTQSKLEDFCFTFWYAKGVKMASLFPGSIQHFTLLSAAWSESLDSISIALDLADYLGSVFPTDAIRLPV